MARLLDFGEELIVDNFAGGGGGSTGIELALKRDVDHAINHAADALGMHRINHSRTVHHCEDVFDVDPATICKGRPVGLGHFSPDCKHFSKAKGGKPLDKRIRGLVLVMLTWGLYRSRVMTMENVEEIITWGPLKWMRKNGVYGWYPDPEHKGRTWLAFLDCLSTGIDPDHPDLPEILEVLAGRVTKEQLVRGLGYTYEARVLPACDYGAPTIRKRLYMIARCDGRPIVWPKASHAPRDEARAKKLQPFRTIAECIDWELPCPSIFLTTAEAKLVPCKRPLVESTLRRIAKGVDRYVLKSVRPFIVSLTHQGGDRVEGIDEPAMTITGAHRGEKAIVTPFITEHSNSGAQRNMPADEPSRTLCAEVKGGHFAMVAGTLVHTAHGETDKKGRKRGRGAHSVDECMPTATASPDCAVVSGTVIGVGGRAAQSRPRGLDESLHTTTSKGDSCLIAANMVKMRGGVETHGESPDVEDPLHTISADGTHHGVVAATIVRDFGMSVGQSPDKPAPTVMPDGQGKTKLLAATLVQTGYGERKGQEPRTIDPDKPGMTAVAGGCKQGLVAAHLTKFCTGSVGQDVQEPGPTTTAGSHSPDTHGGAATTSGLAVAYLAQHNGGKNTNPGHSAEEPASTITALGTQQQVVEAPVEPEGRMTDEQVAGARRVAAFLRQYGVEFEGEFATVNGYVIVDLGMRMLTPRELFRAQGFPDSHVIDRAWLIDKQTGDLKEVKLTKEQQIRMCGNSVCPPVMEAIVRANVPELICRRRKPKRKAVLV